MAEEESTSQPTFSRAKKFVSAIQNRISRVMEGFLSGPDMVATLDRLGQVRQETEERDRAGQENPRDSEIVPQNVDALDRLDQTRKETKARARAGEEKSSQSGYEKPAVSQFLYNGNGAVVNPEWVKGHPEDKNVTATAIVTSMQTGTVTLNKQIYKIPSQEKVNTVTVNNRVYNVSSADKARRNAFNAKQNNKKHSLDR